MPPLTDDGSPASPSQPDKPAPQIVGSAPAVNASEAIVDTYAARHVAAVAVLVRIKQRHKIKLDYYKGGLATSPLAAILREAHLEEREQSGRLQGRAQRVFVQRIFTVIVHLLAVWDSVSEPNFNRNQIDQVLNNAVAVARAELKAATDYAESAAKRAALAWYPWGLPAGALAGYFSILLIISVPRIFAAQVAISISSQVGLSFGFGAVGAIVSVMVRITRGSSIEAKDQGRLLTMLAGAFRPIIGAVFGAMFYVLVSGGLLPLKPGDGVNVSLFFAGIAFLAGFSERWAQDTIVQSTPVITNPSSGPQGAA